MVEVNRLSQSTRLMCLYGFRAALVRGVIKVNLERLADQV